MKRANMIQSLEDHLDKKWDVIIIGGGATGLGCAVDAATRGYKTLLLEKYDFAKGTSSKATKLVHGGVRYLKQGHISLVTEALRERGYLIKNAPHLVKDLSLQIPTYSIFQQVYYYLGLSIYEFLAGNLSLGPSKWISKKQIKQDLPTLNSTNLFGGISFHDGQFDDSRLAIELMLTAVDANATILNYTAVNGFKKNEKGKVIGVLATDELNQRRYTIYGKSIINATGVYADNILQMDEPDKSPTIVASQGSHIIVDQKFLAAKCGLMIPKTSDGRVLFALPWYNHCIIGTTDIKVNLISAEPKPLNEEIEFILNTCKQYMDPAPVKEDVLSVFAGLRPLAAPAHGKATTKEISRSHKVTINQSGLVNIIGGKWTTYRKMAEDTINIAVREGRLIHSNCRTKDLALHGFSIQADPRDKYYTYGKDAVKLHQLEKDNPKLSQTIHPQLPYTYAEVYWGIHSEMAIHLEDILCRRTRSILLNAKASIACSRKVAEFMANELNHDAAWIDAQVSAYHELAKVYIL